jgi:hypothetical protein
MGGVVLTILASLGGIVAFLAAVTTVIRAIFRQVRATEDLTKAVTELRIALNRQDDRIAALGERVARLEGKAP